MPKFNLFSCHKFLEQSGATILFNLATCDANNQQALDDLHLSISNFAKILSNHANWEEHFIFKFLLTESIKTELRHHEVLEHEISTIEKELASHNLHESYLRFRKFYSNLLSHFYDEETNILTMLKEKLSEQDLRKIDYDIYKQMSSTDMVEMIRALLPPCNFDEKIAVLEDLKFANPGAFNEAWEEMILCFSREEIELLSNVLQ